MDSTQAEEIWVNVTEGAKITGYNRDYVIKLAMRLWKKPEEARDIKVRKRTFGYELWLPDLIAYVQRPGRGPQRKRKPEKYLTEPKTLDTV
jgi:hypothetical protein